MTDSSHGDAQVGFPGEDDQGVVRPIVQVIKGLNILPGQVPKDVLAEECLTVGMPLEQDPEELTPADELRVPLPLPEVVILGPFQGDDLPIAEIRLKHHQAQYLQCLVQKTVQETNGKEIGRASCRER